jgi:hypothetical protein
VTVVFPGARQVAVHESHHAAALILGGMPPESVRTDWPDADTAGSVTVDWAGGINRDKAEAVLVAVLLGAMTEGFSGWREFPINPERLPVGARRDAAQAARLADYLGISDQATWLFYVWKANQLAKRRDFRCLVVAIADELERLEVMTAEDLRALTATTEEKWNI